MTEALKPSECSVCVGVGCEYGRYGIDAFLETRAILES
jgi:hypothetical protein